MSDATATSPAVNGQPRPNGLEGVVAASTALSHVYGDEGRLVYRGFDIHELAGKASFEEVAYLLWQGHLPTTSELAEYWTVVPTHFATASPRTASASTRGTWAATASTRTSTSSI